MDAKRQRASSERRARNRALGEARDYPRVRATAIPAGARVKVTKRCIGRTFIFAIAAENATAKQIHDFVGYCFGVALRGLGIKLHAAVMMSNHHHTDLTDTRGELPLFKQRLHSLLAKGINSLRNRSGKVWEDKKCDTRPVDEESLDDLVYTLTNPVAAGLVKWGGLWPGFTTHEWKFGEVHTFKRPHWYFDEDGELPDEVEVKLEMPAAFEGKLTPEELHLALMRKVRSRAIAIQAEMRANNRRFVGENKLLRQRWQRAPKTSEDRFETTPKVAGKRNDWRWMLAIQRNRDWERKYAEARDAFLAGEDITFPYGSYWMPRFAGAKVATAPP